LRVTVRLSLVTTVIDGVVMLIAFDRDRRHGLCREGGAGQGWFDGTMAAESLCAGPFVPGFRTWNTVDA
jgi:hypothetical protein